MRARADVFAGELLGGRHHSDFIDSQGYAMVPLDLMTTFVLLSAVLYAMMTVYIVAGVLRPLLTAAITGLIDLARLARADAEGRG